MAIGDSRSSGISLSNTRAPAVTTTELRRIEAGFGPSMASSSQRCMGNWAHLPIGPAIRPKPIRLPTRGANRAVPWDGSWAWAAQL